MVCCASAVNSVRLNSNKKKYLIILIGSHVFTFEYKESDNLTVKKGSVCVNGVSLTVVNSKDNSFSVAIIPYTFEHTNFHNFKVGTVVNIEFDILGKYIAKMFIKDL